MLPLEYSLSFVFLVRWLESSTSLDIDPAGRRKAGPALDFSKPGCRLSAVYYFSYFAFSGALLPNPRNFSELSMGIVLNEKIESHRIGSAFNQKTLRSFFFFQNILPANITQREAFCMISSCIDVCISRPKLASANRRIFLAILNGSINIGSSVSHRFVQRQWVRVESRSAAIT